MHISLRAVYSPGNFCANVWFVKGYGALIANARIAAGLSADDLAERLGRTRTFVYRIEQESQEPTIEQVNALAALLPVSVEDLLAKMGANLHAPAATRLPKTLYFDWTRSRCLLSKLQPKGSFYCKGVSNEGSNNDFHIPQRRQYLRLVAPDRHYKHCC